MHRDPGQFDDPSSDHRLARVKQLPPPSDATGILSILGDTHDHQYPIYRTAVPPDSAATIATGDPFRIISIIHMYIHLHTVIHTHAHACTHIHTHTHITHSVA